MAGTAARASLSARHPGLERGYESFYVRAVDPDRPRAVWLRHTVHKGDEAVGNVWVTLFGDEVVAEKARRPLDGLPFAAGGVSGAAGTARYELTWTTAEPPLRHFPLELMYRAPLPRTKLESPVPAARVRGTVAVGDRALELDGWPGMVGHNWGAEHAERWIWLHGVAFDGAPGAWLDLALGRVRIGRMLTPWIANGAVAAGGRRIRLRGVARVREDPLGAEVAVGPLRLTARSDRARTAVWRYADPDGGEHHVANCSAAALEAELRRGGAAPLRLRTPHGGAYELGMRETAHGLPVQPFPDPV